MRRLGGCFSIDGSFVVGARLAEGAVEVVAAGVAARGAPRVGRR
ncbi:MAG TPA: hypothetical protein VFK85_12160 [Anaeromyxobacteraceae bacterium]|nr:hypothetical protein [Anaeromyxobacteraceae bacterium]